MLAASFGNFGSYGPPFADPKVQAEYDAQVKKLSSNIAITQGLAKDLVGAVVNATMAAADAKTPEIEAKVRQAVMDQVPEIESRVKRAVMAEVPTIEGKVRSTVLWLLFGVTAVGAFGYGAYRYYRSRA
jgi:hypothetical protein